MTVYTLDLATELAYSATITVNGGGTRIGAISDSNDATYWTTTTVPLAYADYHTTWQSGLSEIPWRIRGTARWSHGTDDKQTAVNVYVYTYSGVLMLVRTFYQDGTSTKVDSEMEWVAVQGEYYDGATLVADGGGPYKIRCWMRQYTGATPVRYYESEIELETTTVPVATVVAAGTVTTTSPTVTITYADGDGWTQGRAYYKIFDSATYGAGGFDPDTSTAVWESSVTGISLTEAASGLDPSLTYKTYARVAKVVNSTPEWSAWANNSAWTITVFPVETSVSATWTLATQSTAITGTAHINLLTENQAGVESDASGWTASLNCSISQSATHARSGTYSLRMSSTASGDMQARIALPRAPVTPNTQYTASAYFRAGASARDGVVFINWYDSADAFISQSGGAPVTSSTSDFNTRGHVTATSPSGAASCFVYVEVSNTGGASELHYVDEVQLAPGGVTDWTKGGATAAVVTVARDDNGTYSNVRDLVDVDVLDTAQVFSGTDYETRRGGSVTYRVTTTVTFSTGDVTTTATDSITATTDSLWWLKPILDPSLNSKTINVLHPLSAKHEADVGVFRPLGGAAAIVVSGTVQGADGNYTIHTSTEAEWTSVVEPIIMWAGTILVQDPVGRHKWIRWTDRAIDETWGGNNIRREIKVGFVEVIPDVAT